MNSFTQTGNAAAEAKISADLRRIVARTLETVPADSVLAILLTGGFGRGEGSVRETPAGLRIMNDYDLAVVPRAAGTVGFVSFVRRHQRRLEDLANELARELGVKQVDLTVRPHAYFRRPPELRIENYEVRMGHRLLFGEVDPCTWMPEWAAADLPLFDGIWLFRNRGLGLLMARLYLDETGGIAPGDRENFFIECNKARMAMGDALLLARRQYRHLYRERLRQAETLQREESAFEPEVIAGYVRALRQKLWTEESDLLCDQPEEHWNGLAAQFREFFLRYETRRLGLAFRTWHDYAACPTPEDRVTLRTLAMALLRSRGRHVRTALLKANRSRNISLIGLLLEATATGESLAEPAREAAARMLADSPGKPASCWLQLVLETLRLVHPGGEAGRLVRRLTTPSSLS